MNDSFRRDFETPEQYRRRLEREAGRYDEPLTVETDIGQVLDEEPLPLLFDMGPSFNSRRMEAAIQRREDRITRLDQRDNW
jgi:hypothetical protein